MATVTGFTADRMKEIEDTTVVGGRVDGEDLVLITREGTEFVAGSVRGPAGPPGSGGGGVGQYVDFSIVTASKRWPLPHGLGRNVEVETYGTDGKLMIGDVDVKSDPNIAYVDFYFNMAGTARVFTY